MIVLASYDAIKEAFVTRGNDFAGRPQMSLIFSKDEFHDGKYNVLKVYYVKCCTLMFSM